MCFNYFCIGLPSAETQIVGLPCFFYFKSPDLLLKPNRIFTAFTLFRFSETSYLYTANNSKQNLFFSCLNAYAHCYCILNFALNRFISTTLANRVLRLRSEISRLSKSLKYCVCRCPKVRLCCAAFLIFCSLTDRKPQPIPHNSICLP